VAEYRAVVGLELERSGFRLLDMRSPARRLAAAQQPPGWVAEWPPPGLAIDPTREDERDVTALVLAKLKALFDFGAVLPDGDAGAIRDAIHRRWPAIRQAREERASIPYERMDVDAVVRQDGTADWGFTHGGRGLSLPGLAERLDDGRPELDLYVLNVVRADLAARLREYAR
jgi:hypothetical protein